MDIKDLKNPSEVNAVGPRRLIDRPYIRNIGLAAMILATAAGALHNADINPATMSQYRGETQQVTAQVVGKLFTTESVALRSNDAAGQSWQPSSEVDTSAYNLVLSVPGESKPVVLAVSPNVYHSYCKDVKSSDYKPVRRSLMRSDQFASCETGPEVEMPSQSLASAEKMDSVELTITRGVKDGELQVESFQGISKLATGVLAKRALMKDTAAPRDVYRGGTMG